MELKVEVKLADLEEIKTTINKADNAMKRMKSDIERLGEMFLDPCAGRWRRVS